jgi:catechol 2,3-dioxygenase-like lactoylglutathione lyase family enzyme
MVLIFHPDATADPDGKLPPHGADGPGHVAFRVAYDEIESWLDRFRRHDVAVEKDMNWGDEGRSLYVRDPAGNSIEVATPGLWPLNDRA